MMLFCEQRVGQWLPAGFLSLLVPATTEATIASSYLRAEAATLFQKLLSLLSKEVCPHIQHQNTGALRRCPGLDTD